MKKELFLTIATVATCISLIGCSTDNVEQDKKEDLFDKFLAGEISAVGKGQDADRTVNVSDLNLGAEEWDAYSVGERMDLDNDGEEELILNGPCGGMYLDDANDKVEIFAQGEGTASCLSYTYCDDEVWIVYSDTTHVGRKYYALEKYSGADNVTDTISFGIFEEGENGPLVYKINQEEVSEAEYNEVYEKFFE